ncbi:MULTISPECIES: EcsC family protein [unclassified Moraxella]|uniref:EcsC family protein n=1 Tax=unclassified Moraxella TaxID=2685852 RepID=UPI00359E5447
MSNTPKTDNLDQFAEALENTDGVEVVGHVDIANKSVQDVLVVKGSVKEEVDQKADKAEEAKAVEKQAKELIESKADIAKEKTKEIKEEIKQQTADIKTDIDDVKDKVVHQTQAVKEVVQGQTEELKVDTTEKITNLKEQIEDVAADTKVKAEQTLETAKDKVDTVKGELQEKADELKEKAGDVINDAQQKAQTVIGDFKQKAQEVLEQGREKADEVKDQLQEVFEEVKQSTQDRVDHMAYQIETQVEKIQAQGEQSSQESQSLLGKIGVYLRGTNASFTKDFTPVDLGSGDFGEDAFRMQASTIGSQLFGGRLAKAQSLVGKVVPSMEAGSLSKKLFDKAAYWANNWAKKDLQKDSRFDKLSILTDAERDDFARDIANQNRALAVMGGLSGLFGVKGVIADTAWLLMVSLKSVYQIALIYDKPLVGAEGVKIAYGVLSGANLSKLQEKQVILTALAFGNVFFINAQDSSLKQELKNIGLKYRTTDNFAKQLDDFSRYIDIDKLNVSWFTRILPMASVGAGVYYNRELIEEVLGTAMATFCPRRPHLLTDSTQKDNEQDS